ncbi:MAG: hypothetical protein WGN25_13755 [Candidatus Electrothrix sp. GW3-4]|uniref:hypothetical protein n=1 Tax=Candidatus Electrothrix sp. GW3-4 TaxID=3126740 RepID=UPI0030D478AF
MEPVTTTIVAAIALGASQGLKDTAAQAVKDSWAALKKLIQDRYQDNEDVTDALDYVRKKPEAEARQQMLANALKDAGAAHDQELAERSEELLTAVEKNSPELAASIGMDIKILKAARLDVSKVLAAQGGTGVKIGTAEIEGTASFSNIGGSSPKQ